MATTDAQIQKKINESVKKFNKKVEKVSNNFTTTQVVLFHKKLAFEAFRRVILRTPVDTGRARGNWQASIGTPIGGILEITSKGFAGAAAKQFAKVKDLKPFNVIFLTNNLPYILVLEGGDHSDQAPQGMVSVTLQELSSIF